MNLKFSEFVASENLDAQRALYKNSFPETHVAAGASHDHYFWKFHGLTFKPPAFEYVALQEKSLVGYYAALPFQYIIEGKTALCGMVCDVMTHSSARGQGVFTKLGRYALDHLREARVGFVSGYPIRSAVLPGHLKVGWRVAFELPLFASLVSTENLLKKVGLGFLAPVGDGAIDFVNKLFSFSRVQSWGKNKSSVVSSSVDALKFLEDKKYDLFFTRWAGARSHYLLKTREFLRWRLSAPGATYQVSQVMRGENLVGCAFLRTVEFKGLPCVAILDLMVIPGDDEALSAVHREIKVQAKGAGAAMLVAMMSRTTAGRLKMYGNGFFSGFAKFKLILKRLDETLNEKTLTKEENWDLMWIDSDDN